MAMHEIDPDGEYIVVIPGSVGSKDPSVATLGNSLSAHGAKVRLVMSAEATQVDVIEILAPLEDEGPSSPLSPTDAARHEFRANAKPRPAFAKPQEL